VIAGASCCGSLVGAGGLAGSGAQVTELDLFGLSLFITFFLDWDLVLFKLEEERSTSVLLNGAKHLRAFLGVVVGAGNLGGIQAVEEAGRKNSFSLLVVMVLLVPPLHKESLTSLHHEAKDASTSPVRGP